VILSGGGFSAIVEGSRYIYAIITGFLDFARNDSLNIVCTNQRGKFFAKLSAKERTVEDACPYNIEIKFVQIIKSGRNPLSKGSLPTFFLKESRCQAFFLKESGAYFVSPKKVRTDMKSVLFCLLYFFCFSLL
ncbi:MAG: hypothetical protein IKU48_01090, partial [Clostridia bacterium]|nr:hypothetical protein [Clostridia bacterium]